MDIKIKITLESILFCGNWKKFCKAKSYNEYMLNEGMANSDDYEELSIKEIYDYDLTDIIKNELKSSIKPVYANERAGDVKHSLADITLAKHLINYEPVVDVYEGLKRTVEYFRGKWD